MDDSTLKRSAACGALFSGLRYGGALEKYFNDRYVFLIGLLRNRAECYPNQNCDKMKDNDFKIDRLACRRIEAMSDKFSG